MLDRILRELKKNFKIVLILLLAVFLRFYKIGSLMHFSGDLGYYYLSARDILLFGKVPLVGIPTSVPVFKQGAIFTWLLAFALWLGNYNPVSGAILTSTIGVVAVWGMYKVISVLFNEKLAVISSLIATTSPVLVTNARKPYVTAFIFPLTILIFWIAVKIIHKKKSSYFWLGFLISIIFQFELAGFIIFPILVIVFYLNKIAVKLKDAVRFFAGAIVGLLPFIVWDLKQKVFIQTIGFVVWTFTKVFEGIFGNFSEMRNSNFIEPTFDFLTHFIYPKSTYFSVAIFLLALVFAAFNTRQKKEKIHQFVIIWLLLGLLSFFIRGIFSEQYMPLLYFPIIFILAHFFDFLIKKTRLSWILLFVILPINIKYQIDNNFFPHNNQKITLKKRLEVVEIIISDVKGDKFRLNYLGPGYMYPSSGNNYQYLLWWKGNEPVNKANLSYAIIECPYKLGKKHELIKDFGEIKIARVMK